MDGMAAMIRLEDSIISHTLRLQEYFHSANITEDDLDYYINYTGLLPTGGIIPKTGVSPTVLAGDILTSDENPAIVETPDGSYDGCGVGLHKIRPSVHLVHGILSLIICLAGCLANILNIVVLSRRELRRNAINRILCSLAVADFLLMLEYIPFACHMYLFPGRSLESFYTYPWAVFVLFHAHFTLVAHTISIWLTLSLAFWRYEVLKNGRHQRRKNGRRCHQERCTRTIAMAYIGSILLCIPSFITFGIEQIEQKSMSTSSLDGLNRTLSSTTEAAATIIIYKVDLNPIAKKHDDFIHKAHLWAYSVVMKLGPCLVLTVLTCWLVRRLWEAERHHQSLTARLNTDNRHQQEQQQTGPPTQSPPQPSAFLRNHHDNQISLTQQLEIRQLNSVMNRDSGVQIIVTEAAAAESSSESPAAACPSLTTTVHPTSGTDNDIPIAHPELTLPQPRGRRKLSVVEFSSVVMSGTSCQERDDDESKTDGTPIVTVFDTEETVLDQRASTSSRSQVSALNSTKSIRHKHQTDRTTRMLVAVLVLFLVTEIPQGIMSLLSVVLGRKFFTGCYTKGSIGEILDFLSLLNSAINFLLYCSMSRQFRRAARTQFRRFFGILAGMDECSSGSPNRNCFFRPKFLTHSQPINISPSNPTRCTQL